MIWIRTELNTWLDNLCWLLIQKAHSTQQSPENNSLADDDGEPSAGSASQVSVPDDDQLLQNAVASQFAAVVSTPSSGHRSVAVSSDQTVGSSGQSTSASSRPSTPVSRPSVPTLAAVYTRPGLDFIFVCIWIVCSTNYQANCYRYCESLNRLPAMYERGLIRSMALTGKFMKHKL